MIGTISNRPHGPSTYWPGSAAVGGSAGGAMGAGIPSLACGVSTCQECSVNPTNKLTIRIVNMESHHVAQRGVAKSAAGVAPLPGERETSCVAFMHNSKPTRIADTPIPIPVPANGLPGFLGGLVREGNCRRGSVCSVAWPGEVRRAYHQGPHNQFYQHGGNRTRTLRIFPCRKTANLPWSQPAFLTVGRNKVAEIRTKTAQLGKSVQTPCGETNVCPATEVPAAVEVACSGLPAGEKCGPKSRWGRPDGKAAAQGLHNWELAPPAPGTPGFFIKGQMALVRRFPHAVAQALGWPKKKT